MNFKPGLVVTNGDTLKGYINYQEWIKNPEAILFKHALTSQEQQTFTVHNCTYFEITGLEAYHRYVGPVSMNELKTANLPSSPDIAAVTDTVFLKELVHGPYAALLSYADAVKTRYFLKDVAGDAVQEMLYVRYFSYEMGRDIKVLTPYRGQLWGLATKYERGTAALEGNIKRIRYSESDLRQIVSQINGLSAHEHKQLKKNNSKIRFLAGMGINRSTLSYQTLDASRETQEASVAYSPALLLGFDTFLNRNTRRLLVRSELYAAKASYNLHKERTWPGTKSREHNDYELDSYTFTYSPQLIYHAYSTDALKVYVGGGFSVHYSHYTQNKNTTSRFYHDDITGEPDYTTTRDNYLGLYSLWYTVPLKAGVVKSDKYDLGVTYFYSLKPGMNSSLKYNALQVSLSYLFTKQ
ncbi:porin family protein [Pontibacter mucosus]|uniref:porin family protein n=1 Tax=Pontibacter mucosus TaxID=1649266 RepID=UPI0011B29BC5|nr:porin family protein [Pontibacter mucosus]